MKLVNFGPFILSHLECDLHQKLITSNVTSVTDVRSANARLFAGTWCWALVSYYTVLGLCCDYFSSSSVVSRAFSALCVYSKFIP